MKVNYIYISALIMLLFSFSSCEEGNNKDETVDLEEFLPKSKKEYNYDEDTVSQVKEEVPDSIELYIQSKTSNARFVSKEDLSNNKHFPDRLDYANKFYHEVTIDSTQYELVIWQFEDSLHTVNAFYNWMDCFGKECKSIRIGEEKWVYDGSFQLFVDDMKLIYIATNEKMNRKIWNDLFKPETKEAWNFHLYQPFKRKAKWIALKE